MPFGLLPNGIDVVMSMKVRGLLSKISNPLVKFSFSHIIHLLSGLGKISLNQH